MKRINIALVLIGFIFSCSTSPNKKSTGEFGQRSSKRSDSLKVISAAGMRQVLLDLVPKFEKATGIPVSLAFGSSGEIVKYIDSGRSADVVIIARPDFEYLAKTEKIVVGSQTDLAMSQVGVAVLKGVPKPDISSVEAFKKAILQAKSIACPDPKLGGSSGKHIDKVFRQLGIAGELRSKLVLASTPDNEKSMPGYLVATGKAEIALHQMQELMAVPGIEIVGPLPGDLQATFVFSAGVMRNSKHVPGANSLIQFLSSTDAKAMIKLKGMEPAYQ